jgi:hypothetical protein
MPKRGMRRRGRTSPTASPTAPGRLANTGDHKGLPRLLGSKGAQDRGGDRRARPSPAWARRRRRSGGAGDLTRAGARKRESDGVCGGLRVRQVTTAGEYGLVATGASRRGSRRSPAHRHGRRRARRPRSAGANTTGVTAVCSGDQGRGVPFSWRPRACPTWPRRGHGGAAILDAAVWNSAGAKRTKGPTLSPV